MKRSRISKGTLLVLAAVVGLILIPAVAWAIPGSGSFIPAESTSGRQVIGLYNMLAKICLVIMVLVEGLLLFVVLKFRRRSDDERPKQTHGYMPLEIGWTVAATIVQIFVGWKTIEVMFSVETIPKDTMTIQAIGSQWQWTFRYPDQGNMTSDDLVFPAHKNIKLEVTSTDVLHAVFIPDLGVKIDAVPGRYNYWWFNADGPIDQIVEQKNKHLKPMAQKRATTRPDWASDIYEWYHAKEFKRTAIKGLEHKVKYLSHSRKVPKVSPYAKYDAVEYRGMCAELCGKGHYNMFFRAVGMTQRSFDQWVYDKKHSVSKPDGGAIFSSKCSSCHASDGKGTPGSYPPLVGTPWTNDDDKKDEHIEIVLEGTDSPPLKVNPTILGNKYSNKMPPWSAVLNDAEVAAVINHERKSWGNHGAPVTEKDVARVRGVLGLPPFPAGGTKPIPAADLSKEGAKLYSACSSCHGTDGKAVYGNVPNIASDPEVIADPKATVKMLLKGQDKPQWPGSHPPMGQSMSDRQIAALLTYMRTSFGNKAGAVQPDEVKRIRADIQ